MRTLTKSRFRLALECPRKLLYTGRAEYADRRADDEYLRALAQGGFQVGALAKLHFPDGIEIDTLDTEAALTRTAELLQQENCTLFEAAFRFENLLVRADIVVKRGDGLELIEVKSSAWPPPLPSQLEEPFFDVRALKKGRTRVKDLRRYGAHLFDIAFQTYVVRRAWPQLTVLPRLCFANKDGNAEVEGIHQRFVLGRDAAGRTRVTVRRNQDVTPPGKSLLVQVRVDDAVARLLSKKDFALTPGLGNEGELDFGSLLQKLSDAYVASAVPAMPLGNQCKRCQFRATPSEAAAGKKSGFEECWAEPREAQPKGTPVTELWYGNTDTLIKAGRYFLEQVRKTDIEPEPDEAPGMTRKQRQWEQIRLLQSGAKHPTVRRELLDEHLSNWTYPLHFIDFETTTVALPFHATMRPYEQIALQFSHHVVHEDGRTAHQDQWINETPGKFPNFDFVGALREALRHDRGTVLRFAAHEHNVLRAIAVQLTETSKGEVPDRRELQEFIGDLIEDSIPEIPTRGMVDMHRVLTATYLHPRMGGSNSLKRVLPAILESSAHLRAKYSKPIYGGSALIPSKNFDSPLAWVVIDAAGHVADPYAQLEPLAPGDTDDELLFDGEDIANGGAAMTAYARMQFEEMSEGERQRLIAALLRYCELDTFAMVMLYEHWRELLEK